jgi:hypothetical protein
MASLDVPKSLFPDVSLDVPRSEYMSLVEDLFDFFKRTTGSFGEHEKYVHKGRKIETYLWWDGQVVSH